MLKRCFSHYKPCLHKPLKKYKLYDLYNPYNISQHKNNFQIKLFIKTIGVVFFFTIVLSNIALSNQTK